MPITTQRKRRLLFVVLFLLVCLEAVAIVIASLSTGWPTLLPQVTVAILGLAVVFSIPSVLALLKHRRPRLNLATIAANAASAILLLNYITTPRSEYFRGTWRLFAFGTLVVAFLLSFHATISLAQLNRPYKRIRRAIEIAAALIAVVLFASLLFRSAKWMLIFSTIDLATIVFGGLSIAILHWLSSHTTEADYHTTDLTLSLTCPRCSLTEQRSAGRSKCTGCGLTLTIEIEEENCKNCGYSLYQLTSSTCPECGTEVLQG